MPTNRFKLNSAKVVHETIEGEAIVIHLETGFYYSLDGTGAEIWDLLAAGLPVDAAATTLEARYATNGSTIAAEVRRLAAELVDEDLLERDSDEAEAGPPPTSANGHRAEFSTPVLKRYTDMQDFLLVDPIHQTTDAGWPETRTEA